MENLVSTPKEQKVLYEVPFLTKQHNEFVLWFFTGSKCNLECNHCYVESGPHADQHPLLSYDTFATRLEEAVSKKYTKLDIYFTGGEPFINPDIVKMLEESLKHGNTTVLTNGTRITKEIALKLHDIQNKSTNKLNFRVSLDGPNAEANDKIRGKKAFERANKGIDNLIEQGFNPIITAMRSWEILQSGDKEDEFVQLLIEKGIPREEQLLKILPPIRSGREVERTRAYENSELFTETCFDDFPFEKLQCSKCRMVAEGGVWVCPILINKETARMGSTIEETEKPYVMKDMECWTCRMDGLSCEN